MSNLDLVITPSKEIPLPDPHQATGFLGAFLPQPPALVLLVGEASAGKTVLAYNLAFVIAEGREFVIGLTPASALRMLYLDLESPETLHRTLVETIGRSEGLAFMRQLPSLESSAVQQRLLAKAREWEAEVIIIDPLPVAWPVEDENDNAIADQQFSRLKQMAVESHCLVIGLWNMGEGQMKKKFKARGATARIDRSDVVLNYSADKSGGRHLEVVKSRWPGTMEQKLHLRFAGDLGFQAGDAGDDSPTSKYARLKERLPDIVGQGKKRQEIHKQVKAEGLGSGNLIDQALGQLVEEGVLRRPDRGKYERVLRV